MKKSLFVILLISLSFSSIAADKDGKYAVKGAGKRLCSDFVTAYQQKSTDYYMYGGWIEGFVSSFNQNQANTYDALPWQTTELVLGLLARHCQANPQQHFLNATSGLLKSFFPLRITQSSKIVKVTLKDAESYYYEDVIRLVEERLKEIGHYKGEVTGAYGPELIKAMLEYQEANDLKLTGIPDQSTLLRMFIRSKKPL